MALLQSLVALSIDSMLPALSIIGSELEVKNINNNQLIISFLFIGFAIGQLIYGPISDVIGRKKPMYLGLILFILGTIISMTSTSFKLMIVGRILQGFGAAAPRVISLALVRDQYEGRQMAKILSFIMSVFILVPILAPSIGQAILFFSNWRAIFSLLLGLSIIAFFWLFFRQPETLPPSERKPISANFFLNSFKECINNKQTLGYTVVAGLIFGAFMGYLNSAQQILQIQYNLGVQFPIYFGIFALSIGLSSFTNSQIVMRYGMRLICWKALQILSISSIFFLFFSLYHLGSPPLWSLMMWGIITFFCLGCLFSNFNTLAIAPMGHIAGTASAIIGSATTIIALILGASIGQFYNGTVIPLSFGFTLLGLISILIMKKTDNI
jgi:DHA1 family bicyclomycin/chloramphenicol resistance-like MFS transporter|tara:strand:- start:27217 stop:28365 length:1149 start_codon:yes stop_codon:yes gene_type:complete